MKGNAPKSSVSQSVSEPVSRSVSQSVSHLFSRVKLLNKQLWSPSTAARKEFKGKPKRGMPRAGHGKRAQTIRPAV